jgi:hypothetical protein
VRLLPIHLHFFHNRKTCLEIFLNKTGYFPRTAVLLPEELIARKCDDLKSFLFPAIMGFDHFSIVFRCKSSLASYVDHHYKLFIPEVVEVELFAIDIVDFEVEEDFGKGRLQALRSRFEDELLEKPSHLYI